MVSIPMRQVSIQKADGMVGKLPRKLFEIPTVGVTRGVVRQEAKHKQSNKEEHNDINSDLEGQHINTSNQQFC
jgi:hypothetical protein